MPASVVPVGTSLVQTIGPTAVVILYLFYEIHYGRVAKLQATMSAFSGAIIALAKHVDEVDERAVVESMPASVVTPQKLYDTDDVNSEEAMEELAQVIREELNSENDKDEDNT